MAMSRWKIEPSPMRVRRLGKTLEETNELGAVLARCIIQGIDEIDPSSGKSNRQRLEEECADVLAQVRLTIDLFDLDKSMIEHRTDIKTAQMIEWEGLYKPDGQKD